MVKTKVFVGNLAFRTRESDLTKEFEAAGKVASANIITRGNRSLGYGFVEMESEEEAKKAVELLHRKNLDGREINVEVARIRDENAPRPPRVPREGAPRPDGGRYDGGRSDSGPRPSRGRGGSSFRPANPRIRPFPNNEPTPRRVAGPHGLFIANLPFTVDDSKLSEIFAGLNIKSAHVVAKRNSRSKGFGFVEFDSAEDQQKALHATDKKVVEGRELTVKIAEPPKAPAAGNANPPATTQ